mmetsp:Transcript_26752/g.62526  ORF Transcript_26752/g.62526 Transcript_26752/m.62526 type:complete len:98 (+) Transcript_26752:2850-3143(+)
MPSLICPNNEKTKESFFDAVYEKSTYVQYEQKQKYYGATGSTERRYRERQKHSWSSINMNTTTKTLNLFTGSIYVVVKNVPEWELRSKAGKTDVNCY